MTVIGNELQELFVTCLIVTEKLFESYSGSFPVNFHGDGSAPPMFQPRKGKGEKKGRKGKGKGFQKGKGQGGKGNKEWKKIVDVEEEKEEKEKGSGASGSKGVEEEQEMAAVKLFCIYVQLLLLHAHCC